MKNDQQKLDPWRNWGKQYVLPDEIEDFTGGVLDYPTIAKWEAEDRSEWHHGHDCLAASMDVPADAYPERVVLFGYTDQFQVCSGRFMGTIQDPVIAYDAASLWMWLVGRVGVQE